MTGVCLAEGLEQLRARGSLRLGGGGGGGLLLPALLPEQIEQVQLGRGLAQHRGLHAERVVGTVELHPAKLGRLDVAAELRGGDGLSALAAEPEAGLEAGADAVSVAVVDAA